MNIKDCVYEGLTPRQRVIATVEAEARGDEAEMTRLKETCPIRHYKMTDSAYSMPMMMLINMSIFVECEIRGHLMGVLLATLIDGHEKSDHLIDLSIQKIADIQAGWTATIEAMGINPVSMMKVGMKPHPISDLFSDFIPEAQTEDSKLWQDCFENLLKNAV